MAATENLEDTWSWREIPVLRATAKLLETPDGSATGARLHTIAAAAGLSVDDTLISVRALESSGLVGEIVWMSPTTHARVRKVSGRARQLVGLWPTEETALDRIIAALEAIAANTDDEDTRTRAQKILAGLTGAGKTIGLAVATAAITGQIPGHGS